VPLPSVLTGLDWPQLAVAAVATGSYATTSIVLQRVVARRRRRHAWRDARFVSQLIDRAHDGSLQTTADVSALYRDAVGPFDGNHHRLERLIDRARVRLRRRSERSHTRGHRDLDSRRDPASERLTQLSASCRAAWMEDVIRNARVSLDDVERIRLDAQKHVGEALAEAAGERRKRRARQRRKASLVWHGVVGAGCIAFVQISLVVWQSLR
jgi:hypothetical protein